MGELCSETFNGYSIKCCCGEIVPSLTMETGAVVETFLGTEVTTGIDSHIVYKRSVKRKLNDN